MNFLFALAGAAIAVTAPTSLMAMTSSADDVQSVRAVDPREDDGDDERAREKKSAPKAERREKKSDNCRRTFWSSSCRISASPSPFES